MQNIKARFLSSPLQMIKVRLSVFNYIGAGFYVVRAYAVSLQRVYLGNKARESLPCTSGFVLNPV